MNFKLLVSTIKQTHNALQQSAVNAVNRHITIRNWLIGYYIVEFEQNGEDRAKYGDRLLEKIADHLKRYNVKGLTAPELSRYRIFYSVYPTILETLSSKSPLLTLLPSSILGTPSQELKSGRKVSKHFKSTIIQTLSEESGKKILGTVSQKLPAIKMSAQSHQTALFNQASFSHLVELLKIDDPLKRSYYELLILKTGLSVRVLRRQIASLAYERTGLSKSKKLSLTKIKKQITPVKPADAVKDFYFFEFLDLPKIEAVEESQLETALLDNLERFIIELGNGFCFEARQKKILIGDEYFSIDMVFYHRILHCHVLIDLKVDKFNHTHASQLNAYLNYYSKKVKQKTDNPPIGILLVTDKNKALVEYASAGLDHKLFVSKYLVQLPSKRQFENFIKRELKKF